MSVSRPLYTFLTHLFPDEHRWKIPLLSAWQKIVGDMGDHVVLYSVANDTLVLLVSHPSWAQELHILSPMIKKKVNGVLGREQIKHLRFKVGVIPAKKVKQPVEETRQKDQGGLQLSIDGRGCHELSPHESKALKKVNNVSLREELAAFYKLCKRRTLPTT